MIDYFFGKPRSGKTYRAMDLIYNDYIKEDAKPKFRNILTNVGGFNFKDINQIFIDKGSLSVAYKLVWKDFYIHLRKMYDMAMDDKSDEELNKYADYHKINDCLVVIDEASLFFKKYDDAISWWLAYHGHFRIRIIIIAQSPKQINAEYMSHTEIYYEAQPQSKQLRNNSLRYIHYSDLPFSKDNRFSSNTIKTSKDIYALYKSGEVDKPKKIVYKFIAIAVIALFSIIVAYNLFIKKVKDEAGLDDNIEVLDNNSSDIYTSLNGSLITFRCDKHYCWLTGNKYRHKQISLSYLKFVLLTNNIELVYYEINCEVYKLINLKRGQGKVTLASMTDYSYFIPESVKNTYLGDLFQLEHEEVDKSLEFNNPFSDNGKNKNDEE